ncbi:MAG: hypothetical protein WAV23_03270 [Minisyncoccia bacterium]
MNNIQQEKTAKNRLFSALFQGQNPVFKNQTDLVQKLIENEKSFFKVEKEESPEKINIKIANLKSLLSQILNSNARRKIKDEFIESVCLVVTEELKSRQLSDQKTEEIVSSIKNSLIDIRQTPKSSKEDKQVMNIEFFFKECKRFYFIISSCDPFEVMPGLENYELSKGNFFVSTIWPGVKKKLIEKNSKLFQMKGNFLNLVFFKNYNWKPEIRGFILRGGNELIELTEYEAIMWDLQVCRSEIYDIVHDFV